MGFIYGLSVVLIIFEGIIVQCEGAPNQIQNTPINDIQCEGSENPALPNPIEDAPNIDTEVDLPILPNDIIELIFSKTDFERIQEAAREKIVPTTDIIMSRILQDHIIVIRPELDKKICQSYHLGNSYITIGNYKGLELFFKKFGDIVKKIEISLGYIDYPHGKITHNIIKRYAKNFEELRIDGVQYNRFWKVLSDGENDIIFPEVKKFLIDGAIYRDEFKLNIIFPKLESFTLLGDVTDVNCLENVKTLKELTLRTRSIKEEQFDDIFANNVNMTMIYLNEPNRTETMGSIAKHLTKLKKIKVYWPGENFLSRANNSPVYKLPSVTHFHIIFSHMNKISGVGNLSFDMPHLKMLTLYSCRADGQTINFIQHFEELEIVELSVAGYNTIKCIEKLKHIKEFATYFSENRFDSLKIMFTNFDKTFQLQTVKFLCFDESTYQKYEKEMKKFNINLEHIGKPTWTISQEERIETGQNSLVFRREPCKCESCEE